MRWTGLSVMAAAVCALSGCVSVDYMGKSYAPTTHVDVYYSMDEVKRPHEVMGKASANADDGVRSQKILDELVKDAMNRGADGIIIGEVTRKVTGTETTTQGTSLKKRKWYEPDFTEHSSTTVTHEKIVPATLIKYRD